MGVSIPIILETLSAHAGYKTDLITPCDTTINYTCKVLFAGTWYDTSAFTLYTTAVTVGLQALVFVSISALADYGKLRKLMLLSSSIVSAISLILFSIILKYDHFWVAALLTIIANIAYGTAHVFYYAYLPTLTTYSIEVLNCNDKTTEELIQTREKVSNDISSRGFGIGYFSGVFQLILCCIFIYFSSKNIWPLETYPLQIVCSFTGVWILVFDVFTFFWLDNRPGPPLPKNESYFFFSWKQVLKTLSHINDLGQTFLVLLAWFIVSDAITTAISIAVLFGKKELKFSLIELLMGAVLVPLMAGTGCFLWNFIRSRFHISTRKMLISLCILYFFIPIYTLIGLNEDLKFGVKTKAEAFFILGYHGILLGGLQSFFRVLFAEMLPKGKENEFFGLYQITDKGSSWIGPLVVGAISNATGSIRLGFSFIIASMVVGVFILVLINPEKGIAQVRAFELLELERKETI